MSKILVVNNSIVMEAIELALSKRKYEVVSASSISDVVNALVNNDISIIILSENIDKFTGIQLFEVSRGIVQGIKSILITEDDDSQTELDALKNNVSLVFSAHKPTEIIVQYVKMLMNETAIQRRCSEKQASQKNIILDESRGTVEIDGKTVNFTPTEYNIFKVLFLNNEKIVSREELINVIWGEPSINPRSIDVHVRNIREKIGKRMIVSVSKKGYRWISHD